MSMDFTCNFYALIGWRENMRYAIYGAGSLGTVLGAYITEAGTEIELINRNKEHVDALSRNGAVIEGGIQKTVPVTAITPDEMSGKYDVIFLLTKQQNNKEVVRSLGNYLTDDGILVTLQNGIPEPLIAEILGPGRSMGCTVEWGATLKGPGVCEFTSDPSPEKLSFQTGRPEDVSEACFTRVVNLLELMGPVRISDNFVGVRWSKLLINATFAGIGTVMGGTFGDVSRYRKAQKIASRCIKECIDVTSAAGVKLTDVQGVNISRLFYYTNPLKKAFVETLLPFAMKSNGSIRPSMLQDIEKGKKCEVDFINGEVCRWGRKYGVPTPVNDLIVSLIHAEEEGSISPNRSNLDYFSK